MNANTPSSTTQKTHRMVLRLVVIVVGMFAFALFIMPPMYDTFCKITGLNGKLQQTKGVAIPKPLTTKESQAAKVTVQFLTNTGSDMPWIFKPDVFEMNIVPGQIYQTHFYVKNPSDQPMVGRAVPSISPEIMTHYLKKIECFCFQEQPLAPGEEKEMGLRFYIEKNTPKEIKEFTVSYMLYKVNSPIHP